MSNRPDAKVTGSYEATPSRVKANGKIETRGWKGLGSLFVVSTAIVVVVAVVALAIVLTHGAASGLLVGPQFAGLVAIG